MAFCICRKIKKNKKKRVSSSFSFHFEMVDSVLCKQPQQEIQHNNETTAILSHCAASSSLNKVLMSGKILMSKSQLNYLCTPKLQWFFLFCWQCHLLFSRIDKTESHFRLAFPFIIK